MPRRSILSATERDNLLAMPDAKDELIRHYTFSETDLSITPPSSSVVNTGFHAQHPLGSLLKILNFFLTWPVLRHTYTSMILYLYKR